MLKQLYHRFIRTCIIVIAIVVLCLINVNNIDIDKELLFKHYDKVVHFLMYFGLVVVMLFENNSYNKRFKNLYLVLFAICLGICVELAQALFTVARHGDIFDMLANTTGVFCGFLFFSATKKIKFFYKLMFMRYPY